MSTAAQPRIAIHEVAPRDGLQKEPVFMPTDDKVMWLDHLSLLGYAKIEVTLFVSPTAIPALRDDPSIFKLTPCARQERYRLPYRWKNGELELTAAAAQSSQGGPRSHHHQSQG